MTGNKHWVEKADLTVQDFVTDGGYLNAEQTRELFKLPIKQSVLLQLATVKMMKSSSLEISKLGFTGRVLKGATENTALLIADRSKPVAGKTTLSVQEFIAEVRIPYDALEDHVRQGSLMGEIRSLLASAISRDIEFVAVQGDTASSDLLLAKLDGFIKQCTTNTVATGGVRLDKSVLKQIRQTLPSEYKRDARSMAYITSDNATIDYADSLSNRATPLGDEKIRNLTDTSYGGSPVIGVPEFPETLGSGSDETVVLFANPKNMHVGIQRDVSVETAKDISARQFIVVATLKMDFKWAHEPGTVKATGIYSDAAP